MASPGLGRGSLRVPSWCGGAIPAPAAGKARGLGALWLLQEGACSRRGEQCADYGYCACPAALPAVQGRDTKALFLPGSRTSSSQRLPRTSCSWELERGESAWGSL